MKTQIGDFFLQYIMSPLGMLAILWGLGFALMLIVGAPLIKWLKFRKGMKWAPREDTPDTHLQKAGVPSMGGIGIIGAATLAWLALFVSEMVTGKFFYPKEFFLNWWLTQLAIFPMLVILHCVLGYLDDHSKATNKGGLSSKAKLLGQIVLASLFLGVLKILSQKMGVAHINMESMNFDSWAIILVALLVIIGTSNAVNLTDGIDGLAAGLSVQVALVFSVLLFELVDLSPSYFLEFTYFSPYSAIAFWAALGGACLGFLAFNKHPAKVFMGDTGSLALGAALGAGAILTRTVWLLPFVGFIFYVEMFSVIAQVLYFKHTRKKYGEGKRLFRRAPLHHHFELSGWSEWRVVATFWGVNLVTTIIGLVLWKMGILPRFP